MNYICTHWCDGLCTIDRHLRRYLRRMMDHANARTVQCEESERHELLAHTLSRETQTHNMRDRIILLKYRLAQSTQSRSASSAHRSGGFITSKIIAIHGYGGFWFYISTPSSLYKSPFPVPKSIYWETKRRAERASMITAAQLWAKPRIPMHSFRIPRHISVDGRPSFL